MRILVVDDEPSNRALAERVLVSVGYAVTTAANAEEALALIQRGPGFDLFVLDILMPAMRGTELAARIRQLHPDAKVLYFTGYGEYLFQDGRPLHDNEAFLLKPIRIRDLAEAVSLMLFGHARGPKKDR